MARKIKENVAEKLRGLCAGLSPEKRMLAVIVAEPAKRSCTLIEGKSCNFSVVTFDAEPVNEDFLKLSLIHI